MTRNRLAEETSPYLLQHKDNPVHWWPWGSATLAAAKQADKPILLSVGYAACHWCHVMAHECFEDADVAEVMNALFVNIKVDREERPDIDAIYMSALHHMGEQGGWPLTMFLTPDGKPFWGGTYFPKTAKLGKPGFIDVMREIERIYREEPDKIAHNTKALTEELSSRAGPGGETAITESLLMDLAQKFTEVIDRKHGGIRTVPKFPQATFFSFLWRAGLRYDLSGCREAVTLTLEKICQGGIYDHLGGGIARYSTDERWLVPHFEKMLYDNALLIELMTEVWKEERAPLFKTRIAETVEWILREMVVEGGGFAASQDADSEGVEGKFYVWTPHEIADVLGSEDAELFCKVYDVTPQGNWEDTNILNRLMDYIRHDTQEETRLREMRDKLFAVREQRIKPGWDDKVLADWNGLTIAALCKAADVFDKPHWHDAAILAFDYVVDCMTDGDRLVHAHRAGQSRGPATASDYANMIKAALTLHGATNARRFLDHAIAWTHTLDTHYWDGSETGQGGYFFTADDTDDVIIRMIGAADEATPNANGVMVSNLTAPLSAHRQCGPLREGTDHPYLVSAPSRAKSSFPYWAAGRRLGRHGASACGAGRRGRR